MANDRSLFSHDTRCKFTWHRMHINAGMHISRGLAQRGCFRLALGFYLRLALFLSFFFFKIRGARRDRRYNRAFCRENSRDAGILLPRTARLDVCMAENVRRIAATAGLTRELASINALGIRFFAYCQARVALFRCSESRCHQTRALREYARRRVQVRSCRKKS